MLASPLRKAAAGVGGVAVLAFGGYYASQSSELRQLQREQQGLETKVFVLRGKARGAETSAIETESLIKALGQQTQLGQQACAEIEQQVATARAELERLEAQLQQQVGARVQPWRACCRAGCACLAAPHADRCMTHPL
jgi:uncharacterized small protein (DUF1192 family)